MQDSLPIYEEILAITEKEEQTRVEGEVKQRRQRLGAGSPEQIRRDVDQEVLSISKVCLVVLNLEAWLIQRAAA
jgi:superkiller protein 3